MSFKIGILICLILMGVIACITYYLGKKVFNRLIKYIPVFSFAVGVLFLYIKLNFISYKPNSIDNILDMIAIIILIILCSIALVEAVIVDIVDSRKLFRESYMAIRNAIKLVDVNKAFRFKMPSGIVKKVKGLYRADQIK
ncbi:hypothetical protein ACFVR1_01815 [Psychrobacillus sp. NPDC058041]|uniref:hypothetical protein n=1 Tax=Psychrobacillus sp. NPDC058041 TaxID=3346310 RepID=UPI0036DAFD4E